MLSVKPEHKTHKCDRIGWQRVWCKGDWTWKEPRNLNGSPCSATHSLPLWVQIRHLPPLVLIFLICKMTDPLKMFFNKKMWDSLIICGYSVFSKTELAVGLPLWPDPLLHHLSHRQQKGAMEKRVNLRNCVCSNGSCWVRTGGAPLLLAVKCDWGFLCRRVLCHSHNAVLHLGNSMLILCRQDDFANTLKIVSNELVTWARF